MRPNARLSCVARLLGHHVRWVRPSYRLMSPGIQQKQSWQRGPNLVDPSPLTYQMELHSPLRASLADHRYLLAEVGRLAHLHDPVAVEPDAFLAPLLKRAVRGPFLPIDGVLVRDWDPLGRRAN